MSVLTPSLIAGDRATLARAITLIESRRADHQRDAQALLKAVLPLTGKAVQPSPALDTLRALLHNSTTAVPAARFFRMPNFCRYVK